MKYFENATAGDQVIDTSYGRGVIASVINRPNTDYVIHVLFNVQEYRCSFTLDGRPNAYAVNQSLFYAKDYPTHYPQPQPQPDLKKDDPVIVWDIFGQDVNRYFSHFGNNGVLYAYINGADSYSVPHASKVKPWDNYRLPTPEELKGTRHEKK